MELSDRHDFFSIDRLIAEAKRRARQRRFVLAAFAVVGASIALACVVFVRHTGGGPLTLEEAGKGPILAGTGDVCAGPSGVWFSSPRFSTGPAPMVCDGGDLRLHGFDTSQLKAGGRAPLGSAFVKGVYRSGALYVVAQGRPSREHVGPLLADVPCRQPAGGWPTGRRITHHVWAPLYANLQRSDVAAWWQFKFLRPRRTVLAVASTHPAQTRRTVEPLLPGGVCVSRSRFSRHEVEMTRNRLESSMAWNRFRIYQVAADEVSRGGEPVLKAYALRMTPQLRAWLRTFPAPGLVRVIPELRRVGRNSG